MKPLRGGLISLFAIGLMACSNSGSKTDSGIDSRVDKSVFDATTDTSTPDAGTDQGGDTGPKDDGSPKEAGADTGPDGPAIDGATDALLADGPTTDGRTADGPGPRVDGPTVVADATSVDPSLCTNARKITLSGNPARGSVSGDLAKNSRELFTANCGGHPLSGENANYYIDAVGGQAYKFTLQNTSSANTCFGYIHTSPSCAEADIEADCNSDGATGLTIVAPTNTTIVRVFSRPTNGRIYFVVDDTSVAPPATYTLTVEAFTPPANRTCANATRMVFVGGTATASGEILGARNEFANISCSASTPSVLDGDQAYWRFPAVAGRWYRIDIQNGSSSAVYPYLFSNSACTAAAIQADCDSGTVGKKLPSVFASQKTSNLYRAFVNGDVYVAVDGISNNDGGPITISVSETMPAKGTVCSVPIDVSLSGSPASAQVTGDLKGAVEEFPALTCEYTRSTALDGGEIYYLVDGTPDTWYEIRTYSGTSGIYPYIFTNPACTESAIRTDCNSGGATGAAAYASSTRDRMYFQAPTTNNGDFYFVMDDTAPNLSSTPFAVTFTEVSGSPNATCATAAPLVLVGGIATSRGNTGPSKDEYATLRCGGSNNLAGGQVYYRFNAQTGRRYRIAVKATDTTGSLFYYVFKQSSCGNQTAIEADCTGALSLAVSTNGAPRELLFTPTTSGTYVIAVDSVNSYDLGRFDISLKEELIVVGSACVAPIAMTFNNGVATASANTSVAGFDNEFDTDIRCGQISSAYWMDGPQAYFSFDAQAGNYYDIKLDVDPAWNSTIGAFLYVFSGSPTNCSAAGINADCSSAGVSGLRTTAPTNRDGSTTVSFAPQTPGPYTIAVDSNDPPHKGPVTVTVTARARPTNGSCASAQALPAFANGKSSVTGSTFGTFNEFAAHIRCGGTTSFAGPQAYYTFNATAGKAYYIDARASFNNPHFYVFAQSSCQSGAAYVNLDCAGAGAGANIAGNGRLWFNPPTSGTYIIAVDSEAAAENGEFALEVTEFDVPTNVTCSTAQALTLPATAQSTTAFAPHEFNVTCGSAQFQLGNQVYYSVDLTAGQNYWVRLSSRYDDAYFYLFGSACAQADIESSCTSGTSGAISAQINSGEQGAMYYVPPTSGTYTIAVDAASGMSFGEFTLEVDAISTPTNDRCSAPQTVTLANGKATVGGFTVGGNDEFAPGGGGDAGVGSDAGPSGGITCGQSGHLAAPQAYLQLSLKGANTYALSVTTDFNALLYYVPASVGCTASAIEAACSSGGSSGGVLTVAANTPTSINLTPPTTGDWVLVIDGATSMDSGRYDIDIQNTTLVPPFTIDFESGPGGLIGTLDWEWGPYAFDAATSATPCSGPPYAPAAAHSGTSMWGTVLNGCFSNAGNTNCALCNQGDITGTSDNSNLTLRIDLANPSTACATATSYTLTYWEHAEGDFSCDQLFVYINGTFQAPLTVCTNQQPGGWHQKTVDLSNYIGQQVEILWSFGATTGTNRAGAYLDDVAVTCQ
jgi:hypothetical protein